MKMEGNNNKQRIETYEKMREQKMVCRRSRNEKERK